MHRRGRGPAQADGLLHHHLHRRHGRQDPADLRGRRQVPARGDGAAAHQPPAGLPGLRQGRRVPAAEPGDVARQRRIAVRGQEAHLREAGPDLHPGAAGPRAVRAVRALHPLLQRDRRRPDDRAAGTRRAAAGRHRRGRPLRVVLLRQHHPDLPGRRPHLGRLPVPLPPLRPRLLPERVRALRGRLRDPHRPPPRQGAAPPRRRGPRGQRGVDLRQGPLRVPLRAAPGPADDPAGAQRRRGAGAGELARGPGGRGERTRRRARPGRGADRRPAHRRGRLRVRQVRAGGAGHQRHRLPGPRAQRGGGRVPGLGGRRVRGRPRRSGALVHRPGGGPRGAARRHRGGGGGPRRLPAAAQGPPQAGAADLLRRPLRHPRPGQGRRHPAGRRPRYRARVARRAGLPDRAGDRGRRSRRGAAAARRDHPRRGAPRRGAGRADRRRTGCRGHRGHPGVDPAPGR